MVIQDQKICPLCNSFAKEKVLRRPEAEDGKTELFFVVNCLVCGDYRISLSLEASLLQKDKRHKARLTWYIRGLKGKVSSLPLLNSYNYEKILEELSHSLTVIDKMDKAICYFGLMSQEVYGKIIETNPPYDYPITHSYDENEYTAIIQHLANSGLLERRPLNTDMSNKFVLSTEGWKRYYDLQKTLVDTNQCFVAIWFDSIVDSAYENGIKKAIEAYDMKALRMDKIRNNDLIDNRMMLEIKRSRFMIADFTGFRSGVYYEAGYAKGLGKPVIFTCKKTDDWKDNLHFDIEHMPFILWANEEELFEELYDHIGSTIFTPDELVKFSKPNKADRVRVEQKWMG